MTAYGGGVIPILYAPVSTADDGRGIDLEIKTTAGTVRVRAATQPDSEGASIVVQNLSENGSIVPFGGQIATGVLLTSPADLGFGGTRAVVGGIDPLAFDVPRSGTLQDLSVRINLLVPLTDPVIAEIFKNDVATGLLVTFTAATPVGPFVVGLPGGGAVAVAVNDKIALRVRTTSVLAQGVGATFSAGVEFVPNRYFANNLAVDFSTASVVFVTLLSTSPAFTPVPGDRLMYQAYVAFTLIP
jgi:hypothetical protein